MKLLDYAVMIAAAEEMARAKVVVKAEVKPVQPVTTKAKTETDVGLPCLLVDEEGTGVLKELFIRSSNSNFKLIIRADGEVVFNKSFDWFKERSRYLEEVFASDEDGVYVLHVRDIKFSEGITVALDGDGTVDEVFYKLEVT